MSAQGFWTLNFFGVVFAVACIQGFRTDDNDFVQQFAEVRENSLLRYDTENVIPVEVDKNGNPLSVHPSMHSLRKRDLDSEKVKHYTFKGFGEHFHMELLQDDQLLAPGFRVYHKNSHTPVNSEGNRDTLERCLFRGKLRYHPSSAVALNLCGGMTGLIKTESSNYLIEPAIKNTSDQNDVHRPHVLTRRSVSKTKKQRKSEENPKHHTQNYFCGKKRRYMPHKPRRKDHWLPNEFEVRRNNSKEAVVRTKRWIDKDTPKRHHSASDSKGLHSYVLSRSQRSVETLVVADREMVQKHGTENVTTYLLTIFNMVAMLYQDSTIGNDVRVILVGLVLLEGDEPGLTLSHNAESSLSSFCQWQSTIHTSKGKQHDHAVLVTGLDICSWKDEPCDTLGYAPISGMCSKYRSCTVNEDSGLALAFTVAHEIGHNFGMVHDGQGESPCRKKRGTIMSASLSGLDTSFLWSTCSKKDLAKFLDSSKALCLRNEPDSPDELQFPNHLPGQLYDADMQCKLQFGAKSRLCEHYPRKNEVCRALWCQRNGRECETKFLPAAEGTPCGTDKWCRKGVCNDIEIDSLKPTDGQWGPFFPWSNCTRHCGGGLMVRERFCDSPPPDMGGNYCKGEGKEYQICGTMICEPGSPEYQMDQCATFNKRTVKGKLYKWRPYGKDLGALSRCRIYCVPDKEDLYLVLSTKLQDGTSCNGNFSGVCIDGDCRAVGCDGKIESNVTPDHCGVCSGDNSTCRTVKGSYHVVNRTRGYHEIIRIPPNTRHLNISETEDSPTYLALKDDTGQYRLNGNWMLDWPGRYNAAGTTLSYRRWPGKPESLVAKGPTTGELIVEVLIQDNEETVINYEFVISSANAQWSLQNTSCSVTCGNGTYTTYPVCVNSSRQTIENIYCDSTQKPDPKSYVCTPEACFARWHASEWSPCDLDSCKLTWQHREVYCASEGTRVTNIKCAMQSRPNNVQECPTRNCLHKWFTGLWSKCRGDCSNSFQTRSVTCRQNANGTAESFSNCNKDVQPPHTRKCKSNNCSAHQQLSDGKIWVTSPWSQCNVACGEGEQTRNVTCLRRSNGVEYQSSSCNYSSKPHLNQPCTGINCSKSYPPDCEDYHKWCPTSINSRLCTLSFYATRCCKACNNKLRQ